MSEKGPMEQSENVAESIPTGENTSLDFLDKMIAEAGTAEQSDAEKEAIAQAMKKAQESYGFDDAEQGRRGFN